MDDWAILPFNGQVRRTLQIGQISEVFEADLVIETGTYKGSSTPYLATLFQCKTYSIEINKISANIAKKRFFNNHRKLNIEVLVGDSVKEMKGILSQTPKDSQIFAYLDAHWLYDIPTEQELNNLIFWGGDWIAVIDDFSVPGDQGYKFDTYGKIQIGLALIPKDQMLEVWVPSGPSDEESGVRSGTAYVFSSSQVREKISPSGIKGLTQIR
jgi:predicted O-methyltransferase YrrM